MRGASSTFDPAAPVRQVDARVTFVFSDDPADLYPDVTVSGEARVSHPAHLGNALETVPARYAQLGSWLLEDGAYGLAPTDGAQEMGWWSDAVSGPSGAFSAPYPWAEVDYGTDRLVRRIRIVGDSAYGEYPTMFSVRLYDQGGAEAYAEDVVGNASVVWERLLSPPVSAARLRVEIYGWSAAGARVKLAEASALDRETYDGSRLLSVDIVEDILSGDEFWGTAVAYEAVVEIDNSDGAITSATIEEMQRPHRLVVPEIAIGGEYVTLGQYFTTEVEDDDDGKRLRIAAQSVLARLDGRIYVGPLFEGVTLADLADAVLDDLGFPSSLRLYDPELPETVLSYAWLPVASHRECLRYIADAAGAVVMTTPQGAVAIRLVRPGAGRQISAQEILSRRRPTRVEALVNDVRVPYVLLAPDTLHVDLATVRETFQPGTYEVVIDWRDVAARDVTVAVTEGDATVDSVTVYATRAVAQITVATAGEVAVAASGRRILSQLSEARAEDTESIAHYGRRTGVLPVHRLIQSRAQAEELASRLLALHVSPRAVAEIEWTGDPRIEPLDSLQDGPDTLVVLRQELSIGDSGLVGRITARAWAG